MHYQIFLKKIQKKKKKMAGNYFLNFLFLFCLLKSKKLFNTNGSEKHVGPYIIRVGITTYVHINTWKSKDLKENKQHRNTD